MNSRSIFLRYLAGYLPDGTRENRFVGLLDAHVREIEYRGYERKPIDFIAVGDSYTNNKIIKFFALYPFTFYGIGLFRSGHAIPGATNDLLCVLDWYDGGQTPYAGCTITIPVGGIK